MIEIKIVIADYPELMMPSHEEEIEIIKNGLGEKTEVVVFEYQDSKKEEFLEIIQYQHFLLRLQAESAFFMPSDELEA